MMFNTSQNKWVLLTLTKKYLVWKLMVLTYNIELYFIDRLMLREMLN